MHEAGRFRTSSHPVVPSCRTPPQGCFAVAHNIEVMLITYTILGVPYNNFSIMGPKIIFFFSGPKKETAASRATWLA